MTPYSAREARTGREIQRMPAQSLVLFGQNIYLLIGLLVVAGALVVIAFCLWTAVNTGLFCWRRKRAGAEEAQARIGPDGRPCPPTAEGLCDCCQRAFDKVYHVPVGPRLCPTCYAAAHPAPDNP